MVSSKEFSKYSSQNEIISLSLGLLLHSKMNTMRLKNESHVVDEDGKVHITSKTYSTKIKPEAFFSTYLKHVQVLYALNNTEKNIMIYLCEKARHDTGEVDITARDRERMMMFFDVKTSAISNNIKSLRAKNILIGSKGSYLINPEVFWRGTFDKRQELLANHSFEITLSIVGEDLPDQSGDTNTI